ncbi:uncharacterized protein DDB_G0271670-like [Rhipicephalus sanguineus]|uniref:uncharacterized protein DDB_G0271670-like n=1 Tax=Rhipicephalus sanguineus TaxID=34632 RepID=UPI001893D2AA|nr:uncharacterized protein DDB_G0271670-like [Rhipicephalus sanguineus]
MKTSSKPKQESQNQRHAEPREKPVYSMKTSSKPKQEGQNQRHVKPKQEGQNQRHAEPRQKPIYSMKSSSKPKQEGQNQRHAEPRETPIYSMKTSTKPKQEGQNQRHAEPRQKTQLQPPTARAVADAARETLPAPVVVVLPLSESSERSSSSTSSSSSCSMRLYGSSSSDTTSTSSSTAALQNGQYKAAESKRRPRYSDASFPNRSKRSSSTDTGTVPEPQGSSRSKFWLYSVATILLTTTMVSVISMSLRAADAEADESHKYVLPKKATTVVSKQCSCSEGSGTNAADHDDAANPDLRRGLTSFEPKQGTAAEGVDTRATGSRHKSATVGGEDKLKAAGGGNASAVTTLRGNDDAVPDDGAPQKLAGKATKSFIALKIGPGRTKARRADVAHVANASDERCRQGNGTRATDAR